MMLDRFFTTERIKSMTKLKTIAQNVDSCLKNFCIP